MRSVASNVAREKFLATSIEAKSKKPVEPTFLNRKSSDTKFGLYDECGKWFIPYAWLRIRFRVAVWSGASYVVDQSWREITSRFTTWVVFETCLERKYS